MSPKHLPSQWQGRFDEIWNQNSSMPLLLPIILTYLLIWRHLIPQLTCTNVFINNLSFFCQIEFTQITLILLVPKCQSVEHLYKTSFIFKNITCLSVGFIKIDNASWIFFINYIILSLMSSNVKLGLFFSIIYLSVKFALISCS